MSPCNVAADITTSPVASPVAWVALTIDCPDAKVQERLRHFYAQALGGEVVSGSVRARGWLLIFEVITDYKPPTWPLGETPKQMHFEWMVEDLECGGHAAESGRDAGRVSAPGGRWPARHAGPGWAPLLRRDDDGCHPNVPGRGEQTAPLTATHPRWRSALCR